MGCSSEGLNLREVYINGMIIGSVSIRGQCYPMLFSSLGFQKPSGLLVTGEYGGGDSRLCSHIGYGGSLRDSEAGDAFSCIFAYASYVSLGAQDGEHFENYIFGC